MNFNEWVHYIPFAALLTKRPPEVPNRPMVTRIMEQGIVGLVAAGLGLWGNSLVVNEKIDELSNRQVQAAKQTSNDIQDIKSMIVQMQRDLYVPRSNRK